MSSCNLRQVGAPKTGGIYMTVTLAADTGEALKSADALAFAKSIAGSNGFLPRAQKPGSPNVYPVDEAGETDGDVALGRKPIKEWHGEFEFCSGI